MKHVFVVMRGETKKVLSLRCQGKSLRGRLSWLPPPPPMLFPPDSQETCLNWKLCAAGYELHRMFSLMLFVE